MEPCYCGVICCNLVAPIGGTEPRSRERHSIQIHSEKILELDFLDDICHVMATSMSK